MRSLRKILAYTESRDADALGQVMDLAQRHGASLTLCDVISPPPNLQQDDQVMSRLNQLSWRFAFENLRNLTSQYRDRVDLHTTILVGEPFLAIMEQVMLESYDLVVHISDLAEDEAARGLNPIGMHLARKCPSLVWSLHPGAEGLPSSVMVAIDRDVSGANPRTESLLSKLMETAAAVLASDGVLHVVHAWQPYGEDLLSEERVGMSAVEVEAYIRAQEQEYQDWFNDLVEKIVARYAPLAVQGHLLRGPVSATVTGFAETAGADLIVMGTVGTSVVPGILIGMSAEALLSSTNIPVLVVKSKDFVTPLKISKSASSSEPAAV